MPINRDSDQGKAAVESLRLVPVTGVLDEALRNRMIEIGKERQQRIGGWTCGANCNMLSVAAADLFPDETRRTVGGFAYPPPGGERDGRPSAHVWFRLGEHYIDPTWERLGWDVALLRYFVAIEEQGLDGDEMLRRVRSYAKDNEIEFY